MENRKPLKIMLVDDEPDILDFLGYNLMKEGFQVITASGGLEAIKKAIRERPDLIILDIMMPECDGIRVCNRLKNSRRADDVAVVFLTAGSPQFARHAMEIARADDFLVKPVRPHEFIGRIRGLLYRFGKLKSEEPIILESGDVVLNRLTKEIIIAGRTLQLKDSEFEILWLLASHRGKIFSTSDIRRELCIAEPADPEPIKRYIYRLQEKIGGQYIRMVTGLGYKFEVG
jgi:two-component system, OmpR family, alkaline phosphatase synthesis response regulator PhoP